MINKIIHTAIIPENLAKNRLDVALSLMFPEYSRSCLQSWVKNGAVTVDGLVRANKWLVAGGEEIRITALLERQTGDWQAEEIELNVALEDEHFIIIDKPAGLVVHPAVGHRSGTLVNALLHRYPELAQVPRAGIIHRIDKDTSGLLLVARNIEAHNFLVQELQERNISRVYYALCHGELISGGTITTPIGRHPTNRLKMAVTLDGKMAVTHYRIVTKFPKYTLLSVKLETGRTHQIRVHMEHLGYPLVGDQLYSKYKNSELNFGLQRQALHAAELELSHPSSGKRVLVTSKLANELASIIELLRKKL